MEKSKILPLTFEERKLIEKHLKSGLSCTETAKRINRGKNTVVFEVRRAGGKIYSAIEAQKRSDSTKDEKYRKLSLRNKGNKVQCNMKQRIEILEMQIEILHETIKGLLNDKKN